MSQFLDFFILFHELMFLSLFQHYANWHTLLYLPQALLSLRKVSYN